MPWPKVEWVEVTIRTSNEDVTTRRMWDVQNDGERMIGLAIDEALTDALDEDGKLEAICALIEFWADGHSLNGIAKDFVDAIGNAAERVRRDLKAQEQQ